MNSNLDKITEILLQTMRERKKEDIIPDKVIKNKLDRALAIKQRKNSVFLLRIPLYHSVAVAVIFFILGFASGFLRPAAPPEIVHATTEVVKYVDRPVSEIRYVKVPVVQQITTRNDKMAQDKTHNRIDENMSISLHDDTILQKMLVTIY